MGADVARAALEGARHSGGVEAGGVTRDSNAHLNGLLNFVDRWSREKSSTQGVGLGLEGLDGNAGTTRS
jgi:hypothetical protein